MEFRSRFSCKYYEPENIAQHYRLILDASISEGRVKMTTNFRTYILFFLR